MRVSAANNQPQDSQSNDTVTIITSATNNQIVKSFGDADYQSLKFSPGSDFLVSQHPVHGLHSLASVIGELEGDLTKAVILGLPLLPENEPVARQSQNFSTTSHYWWMIDIDSLPWDGNFLKSQGHIGIYLLPTSARVSTDWLLISLFLQYWH